MIVVITDKSMPKIDQVISIFMGIWNKKRKMIPEKANAIPAPTNPADREIIVSSNKMDFIKLLEDIPTVFRIATSRVCCIKRMTTGFPIVRTAVKNANSATIEKKALYI